MWHKRAECVHVVVRNPAQWLWEVWETNCGEWWQKGRMKTLSSLAVFSRAFSVSMKPRGTMVMDTTFFSGWFAAWIFRAQKRHYCRLDKHKCLPCHREKCRWADLYSKVMTQRVEKPVKSMFRSRVWCHLKHKRGYFRWGSTRGWCVIIRIMCWRRFGCILI